MFSRIRRAPWMLATWQILMPILAGCPAATSALASSGTVSYANS